MSKSEEKLKAAFAGESQANRKYLFYADKAEKDGFYNIAQLFRAAADAETIHARRHWDTLGMIKDTLDNLKDAVAGEEYEVNSMYPEFIQVAEEEDNKNAGRAFNYALEAEKVHAALYRKAVEALEAGKDLEPTNYYTCEFCGYTHSGEEPPEKCPVCGAQRSKFRQVL
jgi:rubrerythrin